jgi:hypothetical protein
MKTLKTLEVGDFVKDSEEYYRKVLAVVHRGNDTDESVYVLSIADISKLSDDIHISSGTYTSFSLEIKGYTIEGEPEELTIEEVCKELGRTVKIVNE